MLSVRSIRGACPRCASTVATVAKRSSVRPGTTPSSLRLQNPLLRHFGTSTPKWQEAPDTTASERRAATEKVVRDAKQRFRDTLPRGYLNDEELALYERLYGPPLRETEPEDVGIDTHADMGPRVSNNETQGTIIKEHDDGEFEEITYEIARRVGSARNEEETQEALEEVAQTLAAKPTNYIEAVARNQREYDALSRLQSDFEAARKQRLEQEAEEKAVEKAGEQVVEHAEERLVEEDEIDDEFEDEDDGPASGLTKRFHPYTLQGRFHDRPVEVLLPGRQLVQPIEEMLERTHYKHVRQAAEEAFGGVHLPHSPATPTPTQTPGVKMQGVNLPPSRRHMTEIEADAFLAAYIPPVYASSISVLREVRKRGGDKLIKERLKSGEGLSVLDAGAGGAGLIAWEQILHAEWALLKEDGLVSGDEPPGQKTAVIGADRLRGRVKNFLENTTILPRLPDYHHSGEMHGDNLDAGGNPLQRKKYDIILASHLLLGEEQEHYRQAIINNLWSMLREDGGILILLEKGHPRGFEAVARARDSLISRYLLPQPGEMRTPISEELNPASLREPEPGYIIAPCTNQGACPLYKTTGKSIGRKDACHFAQRYVRPNFYSKVLGQLSTQGQVKFSYVAVQRGVALPPTMDRKEATKRAFAGYQKSETAPRSHDLPRQVFAPLKRKGHVTMDMCTPEGKIERWTVPKSHSLLAYHDARKTKWGDLWALGAKTRVPRNVRSGETKIDRKTDKTKRKQLEREEKLAAQKLGGGDLGELGRVAKKKTRTEKTRDVRNMLLQEEREVEEDMERELDALLEDGDEGQQPLPGRRRRR